LGQKRAVRVYRLVMAGSVEERMVRFQEAKSALGKGSIEKIRRHELDKAKLTVSRPRAGPHTSQR
jgi:SNF2 family DNA or RNA helicase